METTAYRPSRGSRPLDSDQVASPPTTASYIRARAKRADLSPDDPIPLFLSDPLSEPKPQEFTPLAARRTHLVPRILAAVLAASAIAVPIALFQSDIDRLLAVSAQLSKLSMAAAADQALANLPAVRSVPLKDATRATNTMLASADAQDVPAPVARRSPCPHGWNGIRSNRAGRKPASPAGPERLLRIEIGA